MQQPEYPSPNVARRDIEDTWRLRSETARKRYETARERYRKLLDAKPEGLIPQQNDPLALARHAESEALEEYRRILEIFRELTVYRRIPKFQASAMPDRGRD